MIRDVNLRLSQQLQQKERIGSGKLRSGEASREYLRLHNAHNDGVSASLGQKSTKGFELHLRSKATRLYILWGYSRTDCSHGHRTNNHRAA